MVMKYYITEKQFEIYGEGNSIILFDQGYKVGDIISIQCEDKVRKSFYQSHLTEIESIERTASEDEVKITVKDVERKLA